MGSPVIFNGSRSKLLTSKGLLLQSGAVVDNDGSKNYVTLGNFENNATTGWSATGCATVTNGLPVSVGTGAAAFSSSNGGQTKGANTNAPAIDSSSALSGAYSLNLATTGAGVIGDGYISQSYTIDKSDQAKVLSYKFSYKVASGTPALPGTSANTYAVAIYDIVNNAWLGLAGNFNIVQSSGTGIAQGSFQTASNTTGIQIFIYSPVAPTGTSSFLIDDVFIGPQAMAFGPAMSDQTVYTPTFTGLGTVSGNSFTYKREGDTLVVSGSVTIGTTTAVTASMSLPSGLALDATKISIANTTAATGPEIGDYTAANVSQFGPMITATGTSSTLVYFGNNTGGGAGTRLIPQTQPMTGSQIMAVNFRVPISGWSSNTVMSNDSDTRVVAAQYYVSANYAVTANQAINFDTKVIDTHSAVTTGAANAWRFTTPVSGNYSIIVSQLSISGGSTPSVYKNGSAFVKLGTASSTSNTTTGTLLSLVAGDYISYNAQSTETVAGGALTSGPYIISINRLSGPAVVASSESVNARYYASATSISGSLATVSWTTKDYDTHNAMSAGIYTIPVSGKYQVNSYIGNTGTFALNNLLTIEIQKNSTVVSRAKVYAGGVITQIDGGVGDIINCLAGDTIRIQVSNSGTTPAIVSSNFENWFSISRSGN